MKNRASGKHKISLIYSQIKHFVLSSYELGYGWMGGIKIRAKAKNSDSEDEPASGENSDSEDEDLGYEHQEVTTQKNFFVPLLFTLLLTRGKKLSVKLF
jgi:hypothetical protein